MIIGLFHVGAWKTLDIGSPTALISPMNQNFNCAVESIYDAAPDPSRWPQALQAIADCFDDVGAAFIIGREDGTSVAVESDTLRPLFREWAREWHGQDFRSVRAIERGIFLAKDALTDRDVVSDHEMEHHPFYKLLARYDLKYFVAVIVSPEPQTSVGIAVQRAITKPAYSEEELTRMQRLGRHVERALRLSIKLLEAERSNVGLKEALSHLGVGVFALDMLGRVVFLNATAEGVLGDGLTIVGGRLRIGPSVARSNIENAIARTLRGELPDLSGGSKPMLIERNDGSWPLTVYVLPLGAARVPHQEFLTHARAIVLVVLPRTDEALDATLVRDLLGLTLGEARIASLIGNGLPPREVALRLGITEETARTTLKRVFGKVGVSRQSELAALLSRLAHR